MAEFIGGNEKDISVGEPIVFENETESKFEVCAGIVFHKSGVYEVSVVGNRTIVSEVPKQKPGKWEVHTYMPHNKYCPNCKKDSPYNKRWDFCPNCGTDLRGEK